MFIIIFIILIILIIGFYLYNKQISNYTINNLNTLDKNSTSNDVSGFYQTPISKIFYPHNENDIIDIINLAKLNNKKIIPRGQSHTMGGFVIAADGYIIDMKFLNRIINFNKANQLITVEPGILWSDLIYYLNAYGYSPITLQSYASFSIGGTTSVNAHGITSDYTLNSSVESIRLIDADGNIRIIDRTANNELFNLVIGGFGLFGVISQITLRVVLNKCLTVKTYKLTHKNFVSKYKKILNDPSVEVKIARLNIQNFSNINLYVFRDTGNLNIISDLPAKPKELSKVSQLLYKWVFPNSIVQNIRYKFENLIGKPIDMTDIVDDVIDKNLLMYESAAPLAKLYSPFININKTHILQEYFIEEPYFVKWIEYLSMVFNNKVFNFDLLNITIRYIKQDTNTFLSYATHDMYCFVFYFRVDKTDEGERSLKYIHNLLVNKVLELNGTFYLLYMHHYNTRQLIKAYPNIIEFFKLKLKYDPSELFYNLWYDRYKNIIC